MKAHNSTLKPGKPMQRKTPIGARKAARAQKTSAYLNFLRKEPTVLRSEQHRRNVAALGCLITGQPAQACHVNFGKGMGMKACDSLCFPLSPDLHHQHDQGGMPREERWRREWEYVDATRAQLIRKNQWPAEVEAHYQKAIEPLARMVHGVEE